MDGNGPANPLSLTDIAGEIRCGNLNMNEGIELIISLHLSALSAPGDVQWIQNS